MRIGIDCRSILHPDGGEFAGVGHYTLFLIKNLLALDKENTYVLFFNENVNCSSFHQDNVECAHFPWSAYKRFLPLVYNHIIVPQILMLHNLDVYHNPANTIPLGYFGTSVITIHDLAIYKNPSWFPGRQFFSTLVTVPLSVKRARRIIAVSDNTRTDLKEHFGIGDEKIKTVFHGVEDYSAFTVNSAQVRESIKNLTDPFFLFIGTIEPRKNLRRLVEAFSLYVKRNPTVRINLVLAGKKGWKYKRVFSAIRRLRLGHRIKYLGYITLDEKIQLLRNAKAFVFPSLYEGFGLPILEAMSLGVPLITTNVGSIPELVIDKALLIDPYSRRSIVEALEEMTAHPERFSDLKVIGKNIAKSYTWEQCARNTLAVYKEAVGI